MDSIRTANVPMQIAGARAPAAEPPAGRKSDAGSGPVDTITLGEVNQQGAPGYANSLGGASQFSALRRNEAAKTREGFMNDMFRGMEPPPDDATKAKTMKAMESFSLDQLKTMQRAGVRFANPGSLPKEFDGVAEAPPLHTPGRYLPPARVIQMSPNAGPDSIRHEMAHAWDDVKNDRKLSRLDSLPVERRRAEIERLAEEKQPFSSDSNQKLATKEVGNDGGTKNARFTMKEMFDKYRSRVPTRLEAFDNPGTREGYSRTSVKEFYAEGYSVFHSNNRDSQAKMLRYAPELYFHLEGEAKKGGLPVPDRSALEALNR